MGRFHTGLTFIEVLVALAIVGIAMTAMIKVTSQTIRATYYIENKMVAAWVAQTVINEVRAGVRQITEAESHSLTTTTMLGKEWYWQATQEHTPNEHIKKIIVSVFQQKKCRATCIAAYDTGRISIRCWITNSMVLRCLKCWLRFFIFTLISMILATTLHVVMAAQADTEQKAERLHTLQHGLFILSRDVEEVGLIFPSTVKDKHAIEFLGTSSHFSFRQGKKMQRVQYTWERGAIWKTTWPATHGASVMRPHVQCVLSHVTAAHFQYLDKNKRFWDDWPIHAKGASKHSVPGVLPALGSGQTVVSSLPTAVKVELTLSQWGTIRQLYVIPSS